MPRKNRRNGLKEICRNLPIGGVINIEKKEHRLYMLVQNELKQEGVDILVSKKELTVTRIVRSAKWIVSVSNGDYLEIGYFYGTKEEVEKRAEDTKKTGVECVYLKV
jgi:hypothetical protein